MLITSSYVQVDPDQLQKTHGQFGYDTEDIKKAREQAKLIPADCLDRLA